MGGSTGINVAGAVRLAHDLGPGHTIVTVLCDYGSRYQSKLFNPAFLEERGLPAPPWLRMTDDPVVSTQWLAERLESPDLSIVDASWFMPGTPRDAKAEFVEGHIPGAVFFGIDEVCDHASSLPHMLASAMEFERALRDLGVRSGQAVVVYDSQGLFSAPRVWWNSAGDGLRGGLRAGRGTAGLDRRSAAARTGLALAEEGRLPRRLST